MFSHQTYLSPFTWRYGSEAMRRIWSEVHKRALWRTIWVALAEAQHAAGLVTAEQLADLRAHQNDIDIERAHAIEAEIHHDLMSEIRCYAEQCPVGGGIIHLGATSADIEDNADAIRLREALSLVQERLRGVLIALAERIEAFADQPCMAFTHLQPAEPTTIGYRLASYGQDLLADWEALKQLIPQVRGKGFKGAVGTAASYAYLLEGSPMTAADLETRAMNTLNLPCFAIVGQVYPRRQDLIIGQALATLAGTLHKFAFDLRVLQSPGFGEWAEPFGAAQVGSSAMPFKRNPINAENIDSLTRVVAGLPIVLWQNMATNLLERTLDDSASRRVILPEAFLAIDEALLRVRRLIAGFEVDAISVQRNLNAFGVFAATERLLMEVVRAGGNRQALHETIREHSLSAWESLRGGGPNTLPEGLSADERITQFIPPRRVRELLRVDSYIGDAPQRALALAHQIRSAVQ